MVSRPLDVRALLALLRGLSAGRLAFAVFAVWALTPVQPASPLVTWVVAVPFGLAAWYGLATALVRLHRAVPDGTGTRIAWTLVGCGSLWVLALVPPTDWLFAFPALCAAAFAAAGALRHV